MQRILPCFWFDFNADEAAAFYQQVIPRTSSIATLTYPTAGLPVFQKDFAGQTLAIELDTDGYEWTLWNAGDAFSPNPSFSLILNFDSQTNSKAEHELRTTWDHLRTNGRIHMPLGEYAFASLYGWVEDRYGVNWQLLLTDTSETEYEPVIPCFLFSGDAQNKTTQAIDLYTDVFEPSSLDYVEHYTERTDLVDETAVMNARFRLNNQSFSAMDAWAGAVFSFSPGASLLVKCATQEDIDRLWDSLSADPRAEQSGWCRDEFGFSWQIVPDCFSSLVQQPDTYAAMVKMKKIELAHLCT
ncbi:VOC family protein [Stomatohabitans albus]|uniref:VOC family protein n=1 Tax=Stomatohabitans albus TaxID=3110766 RepID=UPI00300D7092